MKRTSIEFENVLTLIGGFAVLAVMLFVAPLVGATIGAFTGWVVGLVWGETILGTLRAVGLPNQITISQIGCTAGFVGSFLSRHVITKKED